MTLPVENFAHNDLFLREKRWHAPYFQFLSCEVPIVPELSSTLPGTVPGTATSTFDGTLPVHLSNLTND